MEGMQESALIRILNTVTSKPVFLKVWSVDPQGVPGLLSEGPREFPDCHSVKHFYGRDGFIIWVDEQPAVNIC